MVMMMMSCEKHALASALLKQNVDYATGELWWSNVWWGLPSKTTIRTVIVVVERGDPQKLHGLAVHPNRPLNQVRRCTFLHGWRLHVTGHFWPSFDESSNVLQQ